MSSKKLCGMNGGVETLCAVNTKGSSSWGRRRTGLRLTYWRRACRSRQSPPRVAQDKDEPRVPRQCIQLGNEPRGPHPPDLSDGREQLGPQVLLPALNLIIGFVSATFVLISSKNMVLMVISRLIYIFTICFLPCSAPNFGSKNHNVFFLFS